MAANSDFFLTDHSALRVKSLTGTKSEVKKKQKEGKEGSKRDPSVI
jgi:hypothetical protein